MVPFLVLIPVPPLSGLSLPPLLLCLCLVCFLITGIILMTTEDNIDYINRTTLPVTKLSNLESESIRRDCNEGERSVAVSKSSLFAV